jgi:ATP-binding protein involved in chromosome partitioning
VTFSLIFDKPTDPFMRSVVRSTQAAIKAALGDDVELSEESIAVKVRHPRPQRPNLLPGVKNIIGISSGKGGVGKSTVAANMAVALAAKGYKVGLLDADIFGPSVPKMFGVEDATLYIEKVDDRDLILPIERYGVKLLSIGFLVDPNKPVLWRGGMASNALKQLISDAKWGELDYFLIDMPPGTSDIHLTLVQTLAITGVLVVSTPQEVALADARKGIEMFRTPQVDVPVLGIVENMSWFTPLPHPDERYYLFGKDGAVNLAKSIGVELLGQIPLVADVCQQADAGAPIALLPDSNPATKAFNLLADNLLKSIDQRNASLPPTTKVATK